MTYILFLGALAFFGVRLFGRRRPVAPGTERAAERGRVDAAIMRRRRSATERAAEPVADAIEAGAPGGSRAYLLGGRRAGGAGDCMAEVMDMMSGPGLCTPRDP